MAKQLVDHGVRCYILDGKNIIACDELTWANWLQSDAENGTNLRSIRFEKIGDVDISTVFIGLDHNTLNNGPPHIFETMVFGGKYDGYMRRYSTYEEAEKGHEKAVKMVSENLEQNDND
jgi:hypothetical protein